MSEQASNHFATPPASVPAEKAEQRPAPAHRFPGLGAKIQNRPGVSLDEMASRIHPVRK